MFNNDELKVWQESVRPISRNLNRFLQDGLMKHLDISVGSSIVLPYTFEVVFLFHRSATLDVGEGIFHKLFGQFS